MSAENGAVNSDSADKGRTLNPSSKMSGVSNGRKGGEMSQTEVNLRTNMTQLHIFR